MKWLGRVFWGLWSLVVWPLIFLWLMLVVAICWPVDFFVPFSKFQHRFPAKMLGFVLRICGCRVRIRYHENYRPETAATYVQNHVSMLDGFVALAAIPVRFCGVENAAHYKVPFYGWLMREGGGIPIYPKRPNQFESLCTHAKERVSRGYSILAFPEAHRTTEQKLRPFRSGPFRMSQIVGLPVVPICVTGLDRVLPKGTWIIRPGTIEISVGEAISIDGLDPEQLEAKIESIHNLMAVQLGDVVPEVNTASQVA